MAVFRVEKTKDYTVMANHHLKNKDLSLKSKGLLSQMLSLPENWDYTLKGLSMINKESIDAIREAVRELERAGYIIRTRERNALGHLKGTDYTIFEKPKLTSNPSEDEQPISNLSALETPILVNPMLEKPTWENPTQLNTKKTNIDLLRTYGLSNDLSIPEVYWEVFGEMDENNFDIHSIKQAIKRRIDYVFLVERYPKVRLDEIVDLMAETFCSTRELISVAGDEYPASLVKERLLRIDSTHIEYIFECIDSNTTAIRNIKKYLLTALFNAPSTIGSYYRALANHNISKTGYRF